MLTFPVESLTPQNLVEIIGSFSESENKAESNPIAVPCHTAL